MKSTAILLTFKRVVLTLLISRRGTQMLNWIVNVAAVATGVAMAHYSPLQPAKELSYMCQLRSTATDVMGCPGYLVGSTTAIFSAACVKFFFTADKVVVGATQINGGLDQGEWVRVAKKHFHPNWNEQTREYDIAVVEFARPIMQQPVGILWDDIAPGKLVWMRGWMPFNPASKGLYETTVQILPNDQCQNHAARAVYATHVCAENQIIQGCQNFIDGPLTIEIDGDEYVVGVLSLYMCNTTPQFQIYSRISAHRDFIEPFLCPGSLW
ncbi:hypothetical protein DYB28_007734 [Aphanomyces astaci]|uniref:Peptidase S1 domain-containing protein n=1 Tax=Aphanomyces astaci TaxID=112090 RepID=A0A397A9G1_APHAT|nr:hypothetical protein DYB36_007691 [Aphanomyces astaci]RHY36168.1 hypothetical protein DYB25_006785 [Aphanomyces astaci]RHY38215.1 hypothetical protein DYB34_007504 [Aphanomyces astaci]RHY68187.1 hypothetical protein DYB38_007311 [Aphanomyces astaci]RHY68426.1 hypothetical protein DYB30_007025 [Aphanomyces astaci]